MDKSDSKNNTKTEGFSLVWKSMLAYGIWFLIRNAMTKIEVFAPFWNNLNDQVASMYVSISAWTMALLNHPVRFNSRNILIEGSPGLYVGNHCLGISAMVIFILIILLLNGPWKGKFVYTFLGLFAIFVMNWSRVVGLAFMLKYGTKGFFHFNHTYTYLVMVYGIIFIMIVYFQNTFSKRYFQN